MFGDFPITKRDLQCDSLAVARVVGQMAWCTKVTVHCNQDLILVRLDVEMLEGIVVLGVR